MKLVWSPETASKAYIDTVKSCELYHESGVAELVSAMAAGWNARFIVETWSHGGATATSIGLAVAATHTKARHVCLVPDERSRLEYVEALGEAGMSAQVMVGEAEEVLMNNTGELNGIDFMVVDSRRKEFPRVLRLAMPKLSNRGAVLICKNIANSKSFRWRTSDVIDDASRRLVRSVYLPVGKGLDIAHVAAVSSSGGGNSDTRKVQRRWIKHVDRESGEVHVIRK